MVGGFHLNSNDNKYPCRSQHCCSQDNRSFLVYCNEFLSSGQDCSLGLIFFDSFWFVHVPFV